MTGQQQTPVNDVNELARLIQERWNERRQIIGIDGMDGAGKTWLAKHLATIVEANIIHLDPFLKPLQGSYVDYINCEQVNLKLDELINQESLIIVEGICLRQVAKRCSFNIDSHIYVRRISKNSGLWSDEDICMPLKSNEELKEFYWKEHELIDYHASYRPYQYADWIFDKVEETSAAQISCG